MNPAVAARPDVFVLQTGEEPGPFLAPHLKPIEGLWTVRRRPVFAVGVWNGDEYTPEDLEYHEKAFPQYVRDARPWLTLNHAPLENTDGFIEPDGVQRGLAAVLGNVSALYRNAEAYETEYGHTFQPGELMLADFVNVPRALKEALERGNFPRPSIGLEPDFEDRHGNVWPWILQHVSFQGAEAEAVFTLDDVNRLYGRHVSPKVAKFFQDQSRAAQGRKARCKIFTLNLEPKMDEERILAIEAAIAQMMPLVQAVAAKVGVDEPPPEAVAEPEAELEMGMARDNPDADEEEEFSDEGGATAVAPAPVASADPVGESFVSLMDDPGSALDEAIEATDKDDVIASLAARIQVLEADKAKSEKEYRRKDLKQFVKSNKDRIPALLQPLAESVLTGVAELEAKQKGGKVRCFAKDGKELGVTDALKLFMASQKPIMAALGGTVLDNRKPPEADATPDEWNKDTVAKEVKRFCKENKLDPEKDYSKAFKACAAKHGIEFTRGTARAPKE